MAASGPGSAALAARANPHRPSEYQVEAAYLLNFAKFVRWPSPPSDTFKVCVLGQNPFEGQLATTISGETVSGKPVVLQHVWRASGARGCAILFITKSERERAPAILDELSRQPILTVSDMPGFIDLGGMIQFVIQDDRVRFVVNRDPAQDAGIVMSSDLLKVATRVEGGKK